MQVGDLVKHKYGTLQGCGVVLDQRDLGPSRGWARIAWSAHGQTKVLEVATLYLEVINASR